MVCERKDYFTKNIYQNAAIGLQTFGNRNAFLKKLAHIIARFQHGSGIIIAFRRDNSFAATERNENSFHEWIIGDRLGYAFDRLVQLLGLAIVA